VFKDRKQAGRALGRELSAINEKYNLVVAIPRGGVVVGFEIAKILKLPLAPLVVKKVPTFGQPELAAGAVAPERISTGKKSNEVEAEVGKRIKKFGGLSDFSGKKVILVDDGIATGATVETAILFLKKKGVRVIAVAVPVVGRDEFEKLQTLVERVVALEIPYEFDAIGEFYCEFPQVTDEEVIQLLQK
jgi:putative phosphoribosyl transferase